MTDHRAVGRKVGGAIGGGGGRGHARILRRRPAARPQTGTRDTSYPPPQTTWKPHPYR